MIILKHDRTTFGVKIWRIVLPTWHDGFLHVFKLLEFQVLYSWSFSVLNLNSRGLPRLPLSNGAVIHVENQKGW